MWLLKALANLFEIVTVVGAAVGAYLLFINLSGDQSAVQQGASAAIAVACVALPYCVAGIFHRAASRIAHQRLIDVYED